MTTSFDEKTNMILLSDLSFRMKDNARTFFMVTIVSTVAFNAIGTLFGFQTFLTAGLKNNNPYTFSYTAVDQKEQNVAFFNETIREENMKANNEQTMLRYYKIGQDSILIARESDFNRFAKMLGEDTIDIQNGHVKVVKFIGNELEQTKNLLTEQSTDPNETNYSTYCPPLEGDNMTKLMLEITSKITTKENIPFSEIIFYLNDTWRKLFVHRKCYFPFFVNITM
jgi:hypothetical protein